MLIIRVDQRCAKVVVASSGKRQDADMAETMVVDVRSMGIAVRVWRGEQSIFPAVLLLHATGETGGQWGTVAAGLSRDRTVYGVDLRGHGESDWPGSYLLDEFAADVLGVIEALEPGQLDLIGHSLGGLVGCLVAASRPACLRRLVLEDVGFPHRREPAAPARPPGEPRFDWRVVEQVRPQIDNPDPSWADRMARIAVPTLLIGGGKRSFVPQQHVRELAGRLGEARMTTIEAGHLVHAHRPGDFLRAVRGFLNG